jgi:hypothetical protein
MNYLFPTPNLLLKCGHLHGIFDVDTEATACDEHEASHNRHTCRNMHAGR